MTYILALILFLSGGFVVGYLVYLTMPTVVQMFDKISQVESNEAFTRGKNEVLQQMLGHTLQQNTMMIQQTYEVLKIAPTLPPAQIMPQIAPYTNIHSLTQPQIDNKPPQIEDTLKFIVRKSALKKGTFSGNLKRVTFTDLEKNNFFADVIEGKLVQFADKKVWAGICKKCKNRFVTGDQKTEFCKDTCNQSYNHSQP